MNQAQLLAHFDRVSEAPDAIPRLRRFIFDLAVRGKLVEQDPRDEAGFELLKRIQTEKARLVKEGKIGNQEPFEAIEESEMPFHIPKTWEWVSATFPAYLISDMGKKVQTKDVLESGEFPVVDQGKVFIRGYCNDRNRVIHIDAPIVLFGDHTRETKLINFDFVVGADGVKLLHPVCILTDYYYLALKWLPLNSRGYGRHFKLLRAAFLPLPPFAEQHRIVAKVDELMALCDRLEAAQAERERRRDRLVASSLDRLNNGADADAFRDHARFYFNHLPRLTTRSEHIQQLRQTILNLAVRGKLVPQDSNDEPASKTLEKALLENSRKWRELSEKHGEKSGSTRGAKWDNRYGKLSVPNTQGLAQLPTSWEWVCWESILAFGEGTFKRGPFGSSLTKGIFVDSGYKVYEQYCPINDDCSFARYYITPQKFKELEGFAVKAGDFLISCSGVTLGRITQVPDEYEEGVINQALLRVRTDKELIQDSFFKMLFGLLPV